MTSQALWSASFTKVILSPSAFTVPLRVLSGADMDDLPMLSSLPMVSGFPMVSCAIAARLNIRQAARMGINSFFISCLLDWMAFETLDSCSSTRQAEDWMQWAD